MNLEALKAVVQSHCRELKLAWISKEYEKVSRQAQDANLSYEAFLRELLEGELNQRHSNGAGKRMKAACFPEVKTLEQLDWSVMDGVSKQKILALSSGEYIQSKRPVCDV